MEGPSGATLPSLPRRRAEAALAVLAVCGDRGCTRERLIALLWPESDEAHSRHGLRDVLGAIRQTLGTGGVLSSGDSVRLDPTVVDSDVLAFSQAVASGRHADAVHVYAGPLLDGVHMNGAPDFERWLDGERTRLARQYGEALEQLATASERAGAWGDAAGWWARAEEHDPLNSRLVLRHVVALAAIGDRANALKVADAHVRRLRQELDLEPDCQFVADIERIRRGDAPAPQGGLPAVPAVAQGKPARAVIGAPSRFEPQAAVPVAATPADRVEAPRGHWRRARWPAAVSTVAVVVLAAIGVALWRPLGRTAAVTDVREPVLVLPFDVRATSPVLRDVGELAADRIEAAIEEAALGGVKPRRAVPGISERGAATPEMLSRIAKASGAATLVMGVIYQRGDSVEVQAQVLRARDLRTVFSLPAERGLVTDPGRVLDAMKERLLGAVGIYLSPEFREFGAQVYTPPSSLALLRLWAQARQLSLHERFADAIPVMDDILRRDSTQYYVAMWLAEANFNLGDLGGFDSIMRVMETRRARLTQGESLALDVDESWRKPPEDEYRATMAAFEADSALWAFQAMNAAVRTGHRSEAPRFYRLRDTTTVSGREWQRWYSVEANALHGLGRYDEELALARDARKRDPGNLVHAVTEARALVALGRMAEVEQLVTASRALPDTRAPGRLMYMVSFELFEHRTKEEARRMWERALAWYMALSPDRRADRVVRGDMAVLNYYLGHYAEARHLFAGMVEGCPACKEYYLNAVARVAATQGDTTAALHRIEQLRAEPTAQDALDMARIFALLGRREEVVAALREHLNLGGRGAGLGWHATVLEFIPLRSYPPFAALIAPKP